MLMPDWRDNRPFSGIFSILTNMNGEKLPKMINIECCGNTFRDETGV